MSLRPVQVNIKAVDPPAVARFWARALGWTAYPGETTYVGPAGGLRWPHPTAIGIDVVGVPAPVAGTRLRLRLSTGDGPTLTDPEGNEFPVRDGGPTPVSAIVLDCVDPRAMADFWSRAIDWPLREVTDEHAVLRASGPSLEFHRSPVGTTAPDRLHLDLLPHGDTTSAAEVARLRDLGATDLDVGQGDDVSWTCLSDPEGHEFCVLARPRSDVAEDLSSSTSD